jgi:hypothetical protein
MAPCGKTKCDCGCKKKKTTKQKRKGAPRPRRNIQPLAQPSVIMMPQPSRVVSAVSQISGTQIPKTKTTETQTDKPKMVSMGLQTQIPKMLNATVEQKQKEVVKPAKYQRKPVTVSDIQKKEVVEPKSFTSRVNIESIKQKMKTQKEPYNTVLGVNVPVKREGMFVQKESGLLVPEQRGAPTKEEKQMKEMVGQTKLDKFMIKK